MSQLLIRWSDGDASALAELTPVVYNELRRLARSSLQRGPEQSVLQPTALVHEVWLRLAGKAHLSLETRAQFYALTAKMMRDLLVDRARRRQAAKRGADSSRSLWKTPMRPSSHNRSISWFSTMR